MHLLLSHARPLGVIITVLLLIGVSCSSGTSSNVTSVSPVISDANANAVKSASSLYTIQGLLYHDVNGNGSYNPGDHILADCPIWIADYNREPPQCVASALSDENGHYEIVASTTWGVQYRLQPPVMPSEDISHWHNSINGMGWLYPLPGQNVWVDFYGHTY